MEKITIQNECYECIHKRPVIWNAHIQCINPDKNMTGNPHGISNGWFNYPLCFDPVWKMAKCSNFKQK